MKEKLVELQQRRMDRCQSEQIWAIAVYAGINAFIVTNTNTLLKEIDRETIRCAVGILAAILLYFVFERLSGYYNHRNEIAKLLKKDPDADEYIKKEKSMWNKNGFIWMTIFVSAIVMPFCVTFAVTKSDPDSPKDRRCLYLKLTIDEMNQTDFSKLSNQCIHIEIGGGLKGGG